MKFYLLLAATALTGCTATVPVKHSMPEPPAILIEKCPDLFKLASDEEKLSEFIKIVVKNYTLYHECSGKHDAFVKWYQKQKIVHDTIFNKK